MTVLTENQIETMVGGANRRQLKALRKVYGQAPINWCAKNCKIVNKKGVVVQLEFNVAQIHTEQVIAEMEAKGYPVRVIVLKARQRGETTRSCGRMFCKINHHPNHQGMISAHDANHTEKIFDKINYFQETMPNPLKTKYSSRRELAYELPHNASILVETAGNEDLGRSLWLMYFHGSEVASWPNAQQTMLSVSQCIPNELGTEVILESTAKGWGGYFCDAYHKAKIADIDRYNPWMVITDVKDEDWNGYYRVFNPWHTDPEYRAKVPTGFIRTDQEVKLADEYELDDAQLQWRRIYIREKCEGDDELFNQEYPSNDLEAFLVSGRKVFPQTQLKEMFDNRQPPKWVGKLQRKAGSYDEVEFIEDPTGWLEVWEKPQLDRLYAIGSDSCEGKDPDESNDPDAHSAHVLDVSFKKVVAKITGRMDTDVYGDQLGLLGWWYGAALIGPETNNTSGGAVLKSLRDMIYPHIYTKKTYKKHAEKWTEEIGWRTDQITREIMISDLVKAIRQGWLYVYSEQTIHQMRMFMRDKTGKPTHPPGEHDDDVISLAITLQMAIAAASCMTLEGYATNKWEDKGIRRYNQDGSFSVDDLAVVGAVDTFEDLEWEDEDEDD